MLYLFCGRERKADIKHFLQRFGSNDNFQVHVREVDIERSDADDLLQQQLWDEIFKELHQGLYDVVVVTPPCNSFSRARCNSFLAPGPVPVRNVNHPWGFPWLSGNNRQLILDHNFLLSQSFATMNICLEVGCDFLFEHPEDLGKTINGDKPASVWQLEEMRKFVESGSAFTFAIFQCHFGAQSPKPTRFVTTFPLAKSFPWQGWPQFDEDRNYLGPLPSACSHQFHVRKLIGKEKGKWKTADSAAYPPPLCKWLAQLIVSRKGERPSELNKQAEKPSEHSDKLQVQHLSVTPETEVETEVDESQGQATHKADQKVPTDGKTAEQNTSSDVGTRLHRGQKVTLEWAGRARELVDGFGLCSPTLWEPTCRGAHMGPEAKGMCIKIFEMLSMFVEKKFADPRREAIKLGLGHFSSSPFTDKELEGLRHGWAALLSSKDMALVVPEREPFLLGLIGQSLEACGDPDFAIYMEGTDSFWTGVPVGYDEPLPRIPAIFPQKEKARPLDDSEFNSMACNYKSAEGMADDLEKKFQEEEQLGRMVPTTLGRLKTDFPDRTPLVAAMGAIRKPNGDVRPLHDGTHFVQLNNQIVFQDQLQYPGPEDAAHMVRHIQEEQEAVFALSADIASAHRLVKIRKRDWPLLGCKARSDDKTIWINCVGTFGISSASYWWSRLFSGIGRLAAYIMQQQNWWQLVYVDDLHLTCLGARKFVNLWIILLIYELVGTPFSYRKFSGGLKVQFVGYLLDYRECLIGISKKRGDWLVNFIEEMRKAGGVVLLRRFNEFVGRLGFVARVLVWLKPFMAPLYAWSSVLDRSSVATAPRLVSLVLRFLSEQLHDCTYVHTCRRPEGPSQELFRTDAKCELGRVVLGGVHLISGAWFSVELRPEQAPYLFKDGGESQWASTTAELLVVLVALYLFGLVGDHAKFVTAPIKISAGTDNLANEHLIKKGLTTRWPLCLVYMQMTKALMGAGLIVQLNWRPRDQNSLADALTNEDFSGVDMQKRIHVVWNKLDFAWIWKLWNERDSYLDRDALRASAKIVKLGDYEKSIW